MKNKELSNNKKYEKKYEFITVNFATGDQFKKVATLRSENGPITFEQVNKFYDEAEQEAREWQKNHPGESVTIRELESEDGKEEQVIEIISKKDFICPNNFRSRIYDPNTGEQIIGEENIRREIERRELQWEQWRKEGKLEKINHEIHHTNDGSTVSVFTEAPPFRILHQNEINDETMWAPITGGRLEIENGEESQQIDENRISEGSSEDKEHADENATIKSSIKKENVSENIQKENDEGRKIVEKIKKDINEWSVKKLNFALSNGSKGEKDCLVHDSVEVNIRELGSLIYPVEIFTDSEKKELSEVLDDSLLVSLGFSEKVEKGDSLKKENYCDISLSNNSTSYDNTQQTSKGKNALIVLGVVFVLIVAGLAIVKSRFIKKIRSKSR